MILQFTTVSLSMKLVVPEDSLERHLAASPSIVTEEIVSQVKKYEREHHLGYFPALDYYINNDAIDADLTDALQNIIWVVTNMVRNEVQIKLRPVFSNIKFESIQTLAYTLPSVRMSDQQLTEKLREHFSLTTVKITLSATLIQKISDKKQAEKIAKNLAYQWLKGSFSSVEISGCKALN
jgi:hypothetical protein